METRVLSKLSPSMPHANDLHRFCRIYGNPTKHGIKSLSKRNRKCYQKPTLFD